MTITLGTEVLDLDDRAPFNVSEGQSYDLGDGRMLYAFNQMEGGKFGVYDLETGATLIAPRDVDPSTRLETDSPFTFFSPLTGIFAATALPGGGVRLHYTQTEGIVNTAGPPVQYVRDFRADGTPLGASVEVANPSPFFLPRNTVDLVLSTGDIALAHDEGVTILTPEGAVRGGATEPLGFSYSSEGYALVETEGRLLLISTVLGDFNFTGAPIRGEFFSLSGAPQGAAFDIVAENVLPSPGDYAGASLRLDAVRLTGGDIALVYADASADDSSGGISGLILGPNGQPRGQPFLVNVDETEFRQTWPTVHALDDGGFVATYRDDSSIGTLAANLRVQRFDATGAPVGETGVLPQTIQPPVVQEGINAIIQSDGQGLIVDLVGVGQTVDIGAAPPPPPLDQRGDGGPNALTGDARGNRLEGLGGNDTLDGAGDDDVLLGGDGNDVLRGGDGADLLNGNAGADTLEGGAGGDVYLVDRFDTVIEALGAVGLDEMRVAFDAAIAAGIEQLTAVGRGNIRLDGSAGAEALVGNAGANILVGLGGTDTMTGGAGADVFVLTGRAGTDPDVSVTDWGTGGDRLAIDDQLLGLGTRQIDIRDLTASVFRDLRDSGAVGYNARTGELRLDIDGDGTRETVATLDGGAQLGLDDVLLF